MANILSKIFKPKAKKGYISFNDAVSMVGYEPNFSRFSSQTMHSAIVYSAVMLKNRTFAKLEPRHIRKEAGKVSTITDSSVARVLRKPNHYQTTYEFLAQAAFMRRKDKTCYILADSYLTKAGTPYYTGLYVLLPSTKPILKEYENGDLFFVFQFEGYNNYVEIDYKDVIVWRDNIEDNQYMGGGDYGRSADADLHDTLEAYHEIKQSIKEAAKLGCYFEGYLKINAYAADNDKAAKTRDAFVEDIRTNKGKLPVLDNGADYVALSRQLKMVDAATLNELKETAFISENVDIDILMGKWTPQTKEAFYEVHIEPAAISLGQAMSKVFFTDWQTSHGDEIVLYPHRVQLMATSEIVSIIQSTIAAGVFTKDEYREMLGYAPLPNGEGQTMPRGYNNLDAAEPTDVGGVTE